MGFEAYGRDAVWVGMARQCVAHPFLSDHDGLLVWPHASQASSSSGSISGQSNCLRTKSFLDPPTGKSTGTSFLHFWLGLRNGFLVLDNDNLACLVVLADREHRRT